MQQGSGPGFGFGFGSSSGSGSAFGSSFGSAFASNSGSGPSSGKPPAGGASGFGSFARPQTPSAATSSAPPNTFARPPSNQSSAPSAFASSGFSQGQQQQPGFGRPRPFPNRPRPQYNQSSFGNARPFNGGEHQQAQDGQQSTFGNRPRPFTARSTGPGGHGQEGRPAMSGAFRGGRGGGAPRPSRPFPSSIDAGAQRGSTESGHSGTAPGAGPSNAYTSRPRPRPFANKSTTFNTQQPTTNSTYSGQQAHPSAPPSAFGSNMAIQNGPTAATKPAPTFAFGQSNAFAATTSESNTPAPAPSAFGSSTANSMPNPSSSFGAVPTAGSTMAFGTNPSTSAFGSSPAPATSSSAFGQSTNSSAFGFAPSASQPPSMPAPVAASLPAATGPASTFTTAPAASNTAPTSSFSNFLRKDRTGTSTPTEASGSALPTGGYGSKSTEDEDELRKKRFEDAPKVGNRFLEMKGGREALRNAYIKSGVLPDPDKPTDLALAVKLVGTCQDMCPEFEREEREFQKELDPLELYPGTDRVDPRIAVKIYRRPAAGRELPLPEDVRPPPVLKRTLDYLFHDLLPADPNDPRFTAVQGFLWNRTRAVRQDFIVQSEGGSIAIECHERIARYHILCLHWRGGPGAEGWSEQQELEQLRKTMRSLIEFYDDNRRKLSATSSGGAAAAAVQASPNEAEFRAYNLLLHLRDPETLREAELLPGEIFRAPAVQIALNLRQLAQRSNNLEKRGQPRNTEATLNFFSKFFAELRKPGVNYLMACLAENSFSSVRIGAIKAMAKAYMAQHRGLPVETVRHVLAMDSHDQVLALCAHLGLELEYDGGAPVAVKIHKTAIINEDKPLISPFSTTVVEAKRGSFTSADVVDGRASGAGAMLPNAMIATQGAALKPALAKPTPVRALSSLDSKAPSQTPTHFGASTSSIPKFGQSTAAPDTKTSSAFATSSPSKLSAGAASFTPSSFGTSVAGSTTATPASTGTFGSFPTFGSSGANKLDAPAKAGLPSFGGFGKDAAPESKSTVNAPADVKPMTPSQQPATSSLPGFSFGQPSIKPSSVSSADAPQGGKPPSSFTFGSAPAKSTEPSKTSMPSFISTSSEAQEDQAEKPQASASGPSKQVDANANTPTAASGVKKRRVSDPSEAAASQAAAAAVAEAEAKARAKRKEAARTQAVERAFQKLSEEAIQSAAAKTAAAAIEEEGVRRKMASRNELLSRITDQMWSQLATERAAAAAKDAARKAAAEVFRSRSSTLRAWQRWSQALDERRDREHQRQRLETIRSEIRRRNVFGRIQESVPDTRTGSSPQATLSPGRKGAFSIRQSLLTGVRTAPSNGKTSPVSRRKRKFGEGSAREHAAALAGDAELTARWTLVRRQRGQLWAEGSLLDRLADHIEELLMHFRPADLDGLVVLYSGAPSQHVASSWLRVKFGFSPSVSAESQDGGRDVVGVELADGSHLALVDVTPRGDGAAVDTRLPAEDEFSEHSQVGLVVFETNPAAAQAGAASQRRGYLEQDRKRLEEIAGSNIIKQSRLACRLLLVTWGNLDADLVYGAAHSDGSIEDVDMADGTSGDAAVQDDFATRSSGLFAWLGLEPSKAVRSTGTPARVNSGRQGAPSVLLSRAFDRIGVLELDDASVSIESALAAVLVRAMPDLAPNRERFLEGARRATLDEVAQELVEQWSRTCVLLYDLVSAFPPGMLASTAPGDMRAQAEEAACKALRILTALANHVVRTVVSLSETTLDDGEAGEDDVLELAVPGEAEGLVALALKQLDALPESVEEQQTHLRYSLLAALPRAETAALEEVVAHVNRTHVEGLFRLALATLEIVWIAPGSGADWAEAAERFAELCAAAVHEVAADTRRIAADARAASARSAGAKRLRNHAPPTSTSVRELEVATPVKGKGESTEGGVEQLRELIARTRRFLDTPAHA